MRFCPQCGAPLMAGAKFCVDCGCALASPAAGAGDATAARRPAGRNTITTTFAFVFVAITVLGLAAAAWIMIKTPEAVRDEIASAPSSPAPGAQSAAASNPGNMAPASASSGAVNPAAGDNQSGGLPPGHPTIELPTEARTFVDKIEKDARSNPKSIAAWNKFGTVAMRAAMFDQTYYGKAEEAYGHVLKLDPDNLDALRGIGDIDYDKQHFDEAIAAYEHYLKKKPDDPQVRTDLGTMYLYTGNADQAVVQYKKAIASKPGFFQAYYNMGIAYAQQNKQDDAAATLKQALSLAPDDNARNQVKDLIAKLTGVPIPSASEQAASAATPAAPAAVATSNPPVKSAAKSTAAPVSAAKSTAAAASAPAASIAVAAKTSASPATTKPASSADDFHDAVEDMVRGLPVAGPKVTTVEWPDKLKAKVFMDNFPMDQMPPFAKSKFESDIKAGIESAKHDNNISSPVELDVVDGASGKVMEAITQ